MSPFPSDEPSRPDRGSALRATPGPFGPSPIDAAVVLDPVALRFDSVSAPAAPAGLRDDVLAAYDATWASGRLPAARLWGAERPPGTTSVPWRVLLGGVAAAAAAGVVALGLAWRTPDRAATPAWETLHPSAAREPMPRLRVVDVGEDLGMPDWTAAPVVTAAYRSLRGAGIDGHPVDGP